VSTPGVTKVKKSKFIFQKSEFGFKNSIKKISRATPGTSGGIKYA